MMAVSYIDVRMGESLQSQEYSNLHLNTLVVLTISKSLLIEFTYLASWKVVKEL